MSVEVNKPNLVDPLKTPVFFKGRNVCVTIAKFAYRPVEMLNTKNKVKTKRYIWSHQLGRSHSIDLTEVYTVTLGEPLAEAYEVTDRGSQFGGRRYVNRLVGYGKLSFILSHMLGGELTLGGFRRGVVRRIGYSQDLKTTPEKLRKMIEGALESSLYLDLGGTLFVLVCRTNDLRREERPKPTDKWIIAPTVDERRLPDFIEDIDSVEEKRKSPWRTLDYTRRKIKELVGDIF